MKPNFKNDIFFKGSSSNLNDFILLCPGFPSVGDSGPDWTKALAASTQIRDISDREREITKKVHLQG